MPVEIDLLVSAWENVKKNLIREFCVVEDDEISLDHMNLPGDAYGDLIADLDSSIEALAAEFEPDVYDGLDIYADEESVVV